VGCGPLSRAASLALVLLLLPAPAPAAIESPTAHPWKLAHARRMAETGMEKREARERKRERLREALARWRAAERARAAGRGERARPARPESPAEPTGDPTALARGARRSGLAAFTTPANVIVNSRTGDSPLSGQSETTVAAWGDIVVAAWNDGQGFVSGGDTQGWAVSANGGLTWQDMGTFPKPPGVPNFFWTSDPVLAVNEKTGAFYFAALCDFGPTPPPFSERSGVAVVKGRWNGSTIAWGAPAVARDVDYSADFVDKEWIAADSVSGRVFLSYTTFPAGLSRIQFQSADSNATTWSSPLFLSLNSVNENGWVQGSRPAVDGDGRVFVMYELIGQSFSDYYRVCRSLDGGLTFTPPVTAESLYTNFGTGAPGFNRPNSVDFAGFAADRSHGPNRGRLYLSWAESINWLDDVGTLGQSGSKSEVEPNNNAGTATPITLGQTVRGTVSSGSDVDVFSMTLLQGQHIVVAADSASSGGGSALALRLIAGNGVNRLAFTTFDDGVNPVGAGWGWMFTAPAAGTYHVRVESFAGLGSYRLRTGAVTRDDGERGRDQRDVFVGWSDDGLTWSAPARVSEDAAGFDAFIPEVAVAPDGGVYAAWYDYHDSAPAKNGAESSVYLARSGDGGATWTTLGAMSDTLSDWTAAGTNIEPNQGDYLTLTAGAANVWSLWADVRRGNPDVFSARTPLIPLGAQVAFDAVRLGFRRIELDWSTQPADTLTMRLYRATDGGPFSYLAVVSFDAAGQLTYVDTTVAGDQGYSYRLGRFTSGVELFYGQVSVFLPESFALSLARPRPNPVTGGSFVASFSLASDDPAVLTLHDIAGREVYRRVVSLGRGPHTLSLPVGSGLKQGLYVLRLSQSGRRTSTRLNLVR